MERCVQNSIPSPFPCSASRNPKYHPLPRSTLISYVIFLGSNFPLEQEYGTKWRYTFKTATLPGTMHPVALNTTQSHVILSHIILYPRSRSRVGFPFRTQVRYETASSASYCALYIPLSASCNSAPSPGSVSVSRSAASRWERRGMRRL